MAKYYDIVRFYRKEGKRPRVMERGLTLKQVREHCNREDTRKAGVWFDGYSETGNY